MILSTESDCVQPDQTDYKCHWDRAYLKVPSEKLGWYETHSEPSLSLIKELELSKAARILNIGSGSSTILDDLVALGYSQLIASDISTNALEILQNRLGLRGKNVQYIEDDLTQSKKLIQLKEIDLWNDRAVLHFFVNEKDRKAYINLLHTLVREGAYVIIAVFAKEGAVKCCGLDVVPYDVEMIQELLGSDFELQKSFKYTYTNPNGHLRPYIYTLFKRTAA